MKINKKITFLQQLLFICLIGILTSRCVVIKPPEGGDQEKEPPELVKKEPKYVFDGSTNVKGKTIKLLFNTYIADAPNLSKEIIVMPSVRINDKNPGLKARVKGKKVIIKLKKELEKDTVYTFYFGDQIKSLHENIPINNFSVTFSTGSVIHKNDVSGMVGDVMSVKPQENIFVTLYDYDSKKDIFNSPPLYFTKTDKEGKFKLKFVKPGKYCIYATDKLNLGSNEKKEIEFSKSGFIKKPLIVKESLNNIQLPLLDKKVNNFKFVNSSRNGAYFEIIYNNTIKEYEINILSKIALFKNSPTLYTKLSDDKTKIIVYNLLYDPILKEKHYLLSEDRPIKAKVFAKSDDNQTQFEDIEIKFDEDDPSEEFKFDIVTNKGGMINPTGYFEIVTNKPIIKISFKKIKIFDEKGNLYPLDNTMLSYNADKNIIKVNPKINAFNSKKLDFNIREGFAHSPDGDKSPDKSYSFDILNNKNSGSIKGSLGIKAPGSALQLLDKEMKLIDEIRNQDNFEFKHIVPGAYFLRVILLRGKNEEWYPGDIRKKIEPDPVVFYPKQVNVTPSNDTDLGTLFE